ncbi:MAG: TolC family outer membrane protein [Nitrospiraceae bacterium]|nr:TolC family outer membrane protein [Nitrospiraceae bacterium]
MRHSGRCVFLTFVVTLFLLGGISPLYAEDLISIYGRAVKTDPLLAAASARLEAYKAARPLARSALLPNLTVGAGVARRRTHVMGFGTATPVECYWGDQYSVTLKQPVFDGQAYADLEAAQAGIMAGKAALVSARQDLILRVTRAYFGVLKAEADAKVARSEWELFKKILDQAQAFLRVGTGDITAVQEAQARMDMAEAELIEANNAVRVSRRRLELLTHASVGPLNDVGPFLPKGPNPDKMDLWVQSALRNQPALEQARRELEQAKDRVKIAHRERWPRLDMQAQAGYLKGSFVPEVKRRDMEAGLVLSFPLYLGGSIGAKTKQAEAESLVSQHQLESLRDQVKLDTESAFLNLKESVAHLDAAIQAVKSAKLSMDSTNKGYLLGTRTIIDTLDTTQSYLDSRRRYLSALYKQIVARIELKAAAGILTAQDVRAINSMLKTDTKAEKD